MAALIYPWKPDVHHSVVFLYDLFNGELGIDLVHLMQYLVGAQVTDIIGQVLVVESWGMVKEHGKDCGRKAHIALIYIVINGIQGLGPGCGVYHITNDTGFHPPGCTSRAIGVEEVLHTHGTPVKEGIRLYPSAVCKGGGKKGCCGCEGGAGEYSKGIGYLRASVNEILLYIREVALVGHFL